MSEEPVKVAYLGPEGTFSWFAAKKFLGTCGAKFVPCHDMSSIFEAVATGNCAAGIIPLENSLRGTVGQSFDLFLNYEVRIIGEVFEAISHCLLGGTAEYLSDVQVVYSHPQPLSQCDKWLHEHVSAASLVALESTAIAAEESLRQPDAAAIGHESLAEIYGLRILAKNIANEPDNWTRFVVIVKNEATDTDSFLPADYVKEKAGRTSLLFTLPDKPGALARALNCLAEYNINMRKLESRPLRGQDGGNWKYAFFVDVECDLNAPYYLSALEKLHTLTTMLRVLGSYPVGPQISPYGPNEKGS